MRLKRVSDQVVVVVGASSGIGREAARRLAARGARVVVSARDELGLRSLVDEIRAAGGEAAAFTVDVAQFDRVKALADYAVARYGRIDTWVHGAAIAMWAPVEQTTPAEFKRIIEVNLLGQVYGALAALPYLRLEGRGALIHISSGEAKLPLPLQSAYATSKHGLAGFVDSLRMELQSEGVPIAVTSILPSGINTPIFDKARTRIGVKPRPLPPMYQPELVADAIVYAAEHGPRELVVGGAAKVGILARRLAPNLVDVMLARTAILQRTRTPKREDAPDNLDQPISGLDRVHGDFGSESRSWSSYTWLATHPRVSRTAGVVVVAVAALALSRVLSRRVQPEPREIRPALPDTSP